MTGGLGQLRPPGAQDKPSREQTHRPQQPGPAWATVCPKLRKRPHRGPEAQGLKAEAAAASSAGVDGGRQRGGREAPCSGCSPQDRTAPGSPVVGNCALTSHGVGGSNSTCPTGLPGYGSTQVRIGSFRDARTPCRPEVLAPGGSPAPTGRAPGPRGRAGAARTMSFCSCSRL